MSAQTPASLASRVRSQLSRRKLPCPPPSVLRTFFEVLYYASLRTEEGRPILVHVVYIDSGDPDPNPPISIRASRWSCAALAQTLPFTVGNVAKIALASDPRSSALAVDVDDRGDLRIWGILDQQNLFLDFLNYDSDEGPEHGLFQASIVGLGCVAVYLEYENLAELRVNELMGRSLDVFGRSGPIRTLIERQIGASAKRVRSHLKGMPEEIRVYSREALFGNWVGSLCRLVLRVQRFRHGGAFLLTPSSDASDLKVNYKISYDRLRRSLERQTIEEAIDDATFEQIMKAHQRKSAEAELSELYRNYIVAENDVKDVKTEVEGAIWFISLLSRVDGCIWMTDDLHVRGFGVEITANRDPKNVFLAQDVRASDRRLRAVDYRLFGTRHRSMMRYVAQHPGSLGIVVSQEGVVRLMLQVARRLIFWDNARLQLHVPSRWQPARVSPRPNSPQKLARPGFGPPAEPAREVKICTAARGLHRATHMQAGRAPRLASARGPWPRSLTPDPSSWPCSVALIPPAR